MSGLVETFIKRYMVERINKAETRPEEQSVNTESCWENSWNEIQFNSSGFSAEGTLISLCEVPHHVTNKEVCAKTQQATDHTKTS